MPELGPGVRDFFHFPLFVQQRGVGVGLLEEVTAIRVNLRVVVESALQLVVARFAVRWR